MNPFVYSNTNKRYYTLDYYYKNKFNSKVAKIVIDSGLDCPNRINSFGCLFCNDRSSNNNKFLPLNVQFDNYKSSIEKKWKNLLYIIYFQAGTNTFCSLEHFKIMIEQFINRENVVGFSIATRFDSITNEIITYLDSLTNNYEITLEFGLQTCHLETHALLNTQFTYKSFFETLNNLKKTRIKICIHIINGLPNETKQMMLDTIYFLNQIKYDFIKIHSLLIYNNSLMFEYYNNEKFQIISKKEYIDVVVSQIEILNPEIVIQRLVADSSKSDVCLPEWISHKTIILNNIDKEVLKRDSYQGKFYQKEKLSLK